MSSHKNSKQMGSAGLGRNLPGDTPLSSQEGFFAEATALFNAGKISLELYKHLQSSSQIPFQVSITSSVLLQNHHHIAFRCKNNTLHGLYLESMTVALPEKRDLPLEGVEIVEKQEPISYGKQPTTQTLLQTWFPRPIPPGLELAFTIRFSILTRKIHEQVPYLIGTFSISHLNEKKPSTIQQDFRVRWN